MSAMTDIIDRLRAAGDEEAANALRHACFAANERLSEITDSRQDFYIALAAKDARIAALEAGLKPFVAHGMALGVYGGDDGPFWVSTDGGHRDIPAEDFRTARTLLEGKDNA